MKISIIITLLEWTLWPITESWWTEPSQREWDKGGEAAKRSRNRLRRIHLGPIHIHRDPG